MTLLYQKNDSIEGRQLAFETRQFNQLRPYKENDKFNQMVFPFRIGIQGTISIEQELEPKKAIYRDKSVLNKNDGIRGQSISGFSTKIIPEIQVKPTTHTHKASIGKTKPSFAYAVIEVPKRELLEKLT